MTKTLLSLILFIAFSMAGLRAQISADPTTGCAPLTGVQFEHTYSGATDIVWIFGDGSSANLDSPSHTYTSAGTYTVGFSAVVNGSPISNQLTITVYGNPTASFDLDDLGGCVGSNINFNSTSTGGGGAAILTWQWSFGDGGTNTTNTGTPSYSYQVAGTYDVSLTVTDANGCVGSTTVPQAVGVSEAPTVQFTTSPSPPTSCLPPLNVSFTNQSTGIGMTYDWDFGNGQQSSSSSPLPVDYTAEGVFVVVLTGTDQNNCSVTDQVTVAIGQPVAGVELVNATNDTVCPGVQFLNTSTGGVPVMDYGDGSSGSQLGHTYSEGGWYTATLTTVAGTCSDQTSITFFVEAPTANFELLPAVVFCSSPVELETVNNSVDAVNFQWIVGPDTVYTFEPDFSVPITDPDIFAIAEELSIEVSLTTTSSIGCEANSVQELFVHLPTALHYPDTIEGCLPLPVTFTDYSVSVEPIVSWTWYLGDGTVISNSNGDDVDHIYTVPGEYITALVIENSAGCKDSSFTHTILVGELDVEFSIEPGLICPGEQATFTNETIIDDMSSIDFWEWEGDYPNIQSESGFGTYTFDTPGLYTYTWLAGYNGCYDEATEILIVKGGQCSPGDGGLICDCDDPYTLEMQLDTMGGVLNWDIDYGDGTVITESVDLNPIHTYAANGIYTVTITAYSILPGIPPQLVSFLWEVNALEAAIVVDPNHCVGTAVPFDATPSNWVETSCNYGYQWDFGDGSPLYHSDDPIVEHVYEESGVFEATLFVHNWKGCRDTTKALIHIYGVDAGIGADVLYGCLPLEVDFSDFSTADTTLVVWEWDFGDNSFSNNQNPENIYQESDYNGVPFIVTLLVTDLIGCQDSTTIEIEPIVPNNGFDVAPDQLCAGNVTVFSPFVDPDYHTFEWFFGNGDSSVLVQPEVIFEVGGSYTTTLIVTDTIGCQSVFEFTDAVDVQDYPLAGFSSSSDGVDHLCYPILIEFTDTSIVNPYGDRDWDLGLGGFTIGSETVGTTYTQPGLYEVELYVETTYGCSDTIVQQYQVEGPLAEFLIDDDLICKGDQIEFTLLDTVDVDVWSFDFGDGTDTSNVGQVIHTYDFHPPGGQTIASLTFWSPDSTCAASRDTLIQIYQVIADVTLNGVSIVEDTVLCYEEPMIILDNSSNANTWDWEVQGNEYTGTTSPPYEITIGTSELILEITNSDWGCTDSIHRNITVLALPPAEAQGGEACLGQTVQLLASGGATYEWLPGDFLDSSGVIDPISSTPETMQYTVLVTDTNGCQSTADAFVYIVDPAPVVDWDTTLIIGASVEYIDVSITQGIYTWSPPDGLSCLDCPDPDVFTLEDMTYEVLIEDSLGCFSTTQYYKIKVLPLGSIDIPDVFTPNGDGVNDFLYVNGWGVEELISFEIYNRWGELVFETNDIKIGWDGSYKGVIQNSDTYAFVVRVKNYISDVPVEFKGHINLLK